MKYVVVGTAGHVDHGKSTLVQALTGRNPNRLQEEKTRGITIDLGFAYTVEDDVTLAFVDVPGHERFVRNMLAGVGGMGLVMLHVAANESVMPQTREHFEICRLLGVPAGLVVLTKADLVDAATLEVVRLEVADLVADSFLEGAPVVPVSAQTGSGVRELRALMAALARQVTDRLSDGPPRLPIDRVFTMRGFGTVVTGTLAAGAIAVNDDLTLQPSGRRVKVRGLQIHVRSEPRAVAGQRVAVNVARVELEQVMRGDTLAGPNQVSVTRRVDVGIELLASSKPLRHGARVRFYQGTREVFGRVAVSGGSEIQSGEIAWARLHLEAPATVTRGDRFILRAYSPLATIGGGTVLDPVPTRRGVRSPAARARFASLTNFGEDSIEAVAMIVAETGREGLGLPMLTSRTGVSWERREALVGKLANVKLAIQLGDVLVSQQVLGELLTRTLDALAEYHASHPWEEGMRREELRQRLFEGGSLPVFDHVLGGLLSDGLVLTHDLVALTGHAPVLVDEEQRVREGLTKILRESGLKPPAPAAIAEQIGAAVGTLERVAALLIRQGVLGRAGDLLFDDLALSELKDSVRRLKQGGEDTLEVALFKQRHGLTRKHAIPLLEYLDRQGVTRRVGNLRRIL